MDKCSYFIKDRAMFGSYPSQEAVGELVSEGVTVFVDLTVPGERMITPYETDKRRISFPIKDRHIPDNWTAFTEFILELSKVIRGLESPNKLYLHCKGGHGRSGVVVACILCHMYRISPKKALECTTKCHKKRSVMRDKWRAIGSPQTRSQKIFVQRFFEPVRFYKAHRTGNTVGFSNFSLHSVKIEGMGTFPTSEAAFQAHRYPDDHEYVKKQEESRDPSSSRTLSERTPDPPGWADNRVSIMYSVISAKFSQHPDLQNYLLATYLRPIIYHHKEDSFWGWGDGTGRNQLGKILERVRLDLLNQPQQLEVEE